MKTTLLTAGYDLEDGRNFSSREIESGANVVIIGNEIKIRLFPKQSAVDKVISVGGQKAKVIGVFKEKGSSIGFGGDKMVLLPVLERS
jgi:putative ABC transport system permease protein